MSSTNKRPPYFCFFIEVCEMLSLLEVEEAGRTIQAVSEYFIDGVVPDDLNRREKMVFERIKQDIDLSFEKYEAAVANGKKGSEKRYGSSKEKQ